MQFARAGHRATLLGSGEVLVTGGEQHIELYDPATATFRATDELLRSDQLFLQAAVALADGGALVTGGAATADDGIASLAAVRFGADGKLVGAPTIMLAGRAEHTATRLADGRVLLAGGCAELVRGACVAGA